MILKLFLEAMLVLFGMFFDKVFGESGEDKEECTMEKVIASKALRHEGNL